MVISFYSIIEKSKLFWKMEKCSLKETYDLEVGAGTYSPDVVFNAMIPQKNYRIAFVQASRRPADSRYGKHPNRLQKHHQFQVFLSPAPKNVRDLVLQYLEFLGCNRLEEDIRFVQDNWNSPTLGASGYGYEVWINGIEVLQLTYFQQMGGRNCPSVPLELAFGLERLVVALNKKFSSIYEAPWDSSNSQTYRDLFQEQENEFSKYNLLLANTETIQRHLIDYLNESMALSSQHKLPRVGYECFLKANHLFNILEARGILGQAERADYLSRLRKTCYSALNCHLDNWKKGIER